MRTPGSKNRQHSVICKERHSKLLERIKKQEEIHARDLRIMWIKLKDRQLSARAQAGEIGKIIKHLKGRDLWPVK